MDCVLYFKNCVQKLVLGLLGLHWRLITTFWKYGEADSRNWYTASRTIRAMLNFLARASEILGDAHGKDFKNKKKCESSSDTWRHLGFYVYHITLLHALEFPAKYFHVLSKFSLKSLFWLACASGSTRAFGRSFRKIRSLSNWDANVCEDGCWDSNLLFALFLLLLAHSFLFYFAWRCVNAKN